MNKQKNWHEEHIETLDFGSRFADSVAKKYGILEIHYRLNRFGNSLDGSKHYRLFL